MKRRRIIAVVVVAPALGIAVPVIPPVVAEDNACTTWTVGMVEDEGGPVLTAQACSTESPEAWMTLTCFSGSVNVRYDLALGVEADLSNEVTDVTFASGSDEVTLPMGFEEMDGRHAANSEAAGPLVQLLRAGETVTIKDVAGKYPVRQFSLNGSSAALGKLVADCN
jgi:hypothetical protein